MQRTQTICLVILATIAVGFSLALLKTVLLPFVIAAFILIGCRPILSLVEDRLKLHRYVAFAVTLTVGAILLSALVFFIWISVNDLATHSEAYEERFDHIAAWIVEKIPDAEPAATDSSVESPSKIDSQQSTPPSPEVNLDSNSRGGVNDNPKESVQLLLAYAADYMDSQMLNLAASLSGLLSYGILILIFVLFLLLAQNETTTSREIGRSNRRNFLTEIEEQIRKYLVMKTVISFFTGLAFGLVLWFFGVPLAILFGFLAFVLNFLPNIGPLISTALPIPFLVLNSSISPGYAILCFLLCASIQFVSGNIIETRMMGKSFDVSPAFLLLALMFFGLIWGIIGMFLATPIVSIIKIVLQQNESTRSVADLMAGRWTFQHPQV